MAYWGECPKCRGDKKCQRCGGEGTRWTGFSRMTCSDCRGTGKCQECDGYGKVKKY